jgi:hypothetical protein
MQLNSPLVSWQYAMYFDNSLVRIETPGRSRFLIFSLVVRLALASWRTEGGAMTHAATPIGNATQATNQNTQRQLVYSTKTLPRRKPLTAGGGQQREGWSFDA